MGENLDCLESFRPNDLRPAAVASTAGRLQQEWNYLQSVHLRNIIHVGGQEDKAVAARDSRDDPLMNTSSESGQAAKSKSCRRFSKWLNTLLSTINPMDSPPRETQPECS